VLGADVVFPALHGPFGEDGTVQGLLELADVPYVGAGVLASALCMDKVTFKDVMAHASIPQVAYRRARAGNDLRGLDALGLPVFVKPARLGSSVGISKAGTAAELEAALDEAWRHDPLAIVEALSQGMEVECSVIGNDDPIASEPGELVVNAEWYDYDAKYKPGGMELVVPARLDDAVRARIRELAVEVFKRVACAGLARVDFFVEDGGRVLVNELNTMPGFTETSVFPKLFEQSGLSFPDLLSRLVELALERHERERKYRF
jgi:D-alanine-D-alanine ligase